MELLQPTDTEPRESVSMDAQSVFAGGYPDGWRVMDDSGYRYVAHGGQWYPQRWPDEVVRRFEGGA